MLEKLNGNKTFIGLILMGFYGVGLGLWPQLGTFLDPDIIWPILQTWTGVGVAHKLSKMEP